MIMVRTGAWLEPCHKTIFQLGFPIKYDIPMQTKCTMGKKFVAKSSMGNLEDIGLQFLASGLSFREKHTLFMHFSCATKHCQKLGIYLVGLPYALYERPGQNEICVESA